jgi:hypothetical protein
MGRDFDVFVLESCPQSPLARDAGHKVEGIGNYAGRSLREVAQPIENGHSLIVSPISSSRAKQHGIGVGETAYLSGIVEKIEEVPDTGDITGLLH